MDEQKTKRVVEWSFSFGDVGDSINQTLRNLGIDEEVKTAHFNAPLGDAASARVQLDLSVGKMIVRALDSSDNLIEADVRYLGEMDFTVSGDVDKSVRLGQKQAPSIMGPFKNMLGAVGNHDDLRWEVGLSPNLPIDLHINGGVGASKLDLSGLQIKALHLNGGVGETQLNLPVMPESYSIDVNGGVGSTTITIPEGAVVRMKANGGVGGMKLRLPETAAVRIEIQGGLGGAKLPARFNRVKSGGDFISSSGVWETPGFALASSQIIIHFKGGVGGLKVT